MSKTEKLLTKLRTAKNSYMWSDLVTLLTRIGYAKQEMTGSRVRFSKPGSLILMHRPHPENEVKGGALRAVKEVLLREGWL